MLRAQYKSVRMLATSNNVAAASADMRNVDVRETAIDEHRAQFLAAFEDAQDKSAKLRAQGLETMCKLLIKQAMPANCLQEESSELMRYLMKSLQTRSVDAERLLGAKLSTLLVLQQPTTFLSLVQELTPLLLSNINNECLGFNVRAKLCHSLGLLNLLYPVRFNDLLPIMQRLRNIFAESYNDKQSIDAEAAMLHAAALSNWTLLLTLQPVELLKPLQGDQKLTAFPSIRQMLALLKSRHLSVRLAAGKLLALTKEYEGLHKADYQLKQTRHDIIAVMQKLVYDATKHQSKRERKFQQANIRAILQYFKNDAAPYELVRFGSESLELQSWALQLRYEALCLLLGDAMTTQLQQNESVRQLFQIEKRTAKQTAPKEKEKLLIERKERRTEEKITSKERSVARRKQQNKRTFNLDED